MKIIHWRKEETERARKGRISQTGSLSGELDRCYCNHFYLRQVKVGQVMRFRCDYHTPEKGKEDRWSVIVGDRMRDIMAGDAAGVPLGVFRCSENADSQKEWHDGAIPKFQSISEFHKLQQVDEILPLIQQYRES